MSCDLCGANGLLVDVLDSYKTQDVAKICGNCSSDLEGACKALESINKDVRKKINKRAQRVMLGNLQSRAWWSIRIGNKGELLSRIFNMKGGA